jgi:hypothetical protein
MFRSRNYNGHGLTFECLDGTVKEFPLMEALTGTYIMSPKLLISNPPSLDW